MNEMVERVARAICTEQPGCKIGGRSPDDRNTLRGTPLWMSFASEARAAIAALREPTEAMIDAAWPLVADSLGADRAASREIATAVWIAMIDQALKP